MRSETFNPSWFNYGDPVEFAEEFNNKKTVGGGGAFGSTAEGFTVSSIKPDILHTTTENVQSGSNRG